MRNCLFILLILCFSACAPSTHLVYIDDWEGKYTLWEDGPCCEGEKPVTMDVIKKQHEEYEWVIIRKDSFSADSLKGTASYVNNKLKFRTRDVESASTYFKNPVLSNEVLFYLEYDGFRDKDKFYIEHYTRWNNYLKGYENIHALFAGTFFHFKKDGGEEKVWDKIKMKSQKNN